MKLERDEKGRFVKGNKEGYRIKPEDKHIHRKGADATNEIRREKKLLREELRAILNEETTKGSGVTKMQSLIHNVLKNTLKKGRALDLKHLAEILGEMEINVNLNQAEKPRIIFEDSEE